LFTTQPRLF